ncbi:hypothetical protein ACHAXM_004142 [Skeletonema potamos]|jgi:hypothetical protein
MSKQSTKSEAAVPVPIQFHSEFMGNISDGEAVVRESKGGELEVLILPVKNDENEMMTVVDEISDEIISVMAENTFPLVHNVAKSVSNKLVSKVSDTFVPVLIAATSLSTRFGEKFNDDASKLADDASVLYSKFNDDASKFADDASVLYSKMGEKFGELNDDATALILELNDDATALISVLNDDATALIFPDDDDERFDATPQPQKSSVMSVETGSKSSTKKASVVQIRVEPQEPQEDQRDDDVWTPILKMISACGARECIEGVNDGFTDYVCFARDNDNGGMTVEERAKEAADAAINDVFPAATTKSKDKMSMKEKVKSAKMKMKTKMFRRRAVSTTS